MSAIPGQILDDGVNSIDSNYLQFVVGLLDDTDNNSYSDYVGRERADSISEFLRRERADSITDFLRRERQDSITDFLPKQSDFLMRDRAFSWDLNMEEQMHPETTKGKGIATSIPATSFPQKAEPLSAKSTYDNSGGDKKRKLDKVTPSYNKPLKGHSSVKSPPIPTKVAGKGTSASVKHKAPVSKSTTAEQNNLKRLKASESLKTHPRTSNEQFNGDPTLINTSLIPGAILGQVGQHRPLTQSGPNLTRFDPVSMHLIDQAGLMPPVHPLDASCPRIGAYTKEERQVIIAKFRAKKMRRVWRKQIKYDCRKRLADTRPRVKGRFVSRKERENQEVESAGAGPLEGETELETTSGEGDYDDDE